MKGIALLFSAVFFAGVLAADFCFGQLLKRGYAVASEEWKREGRPTWWTWRPTEMVAPAWYYNAPRWRWIWSGPPWARTDRTSRSLHRLHRLLLMLTIAAWVGLLVVLAIASHAR